MLPHLICFFCHSTLKIYSYKNLFWAELNNDGHFKVCISRKISSAHNIYRLRLFTSYPALFATGYVFGGISKILISKSVLARFCQNFPSRGIASFGIWWIIRIPAYEVQPLFSLTTKSRETFYFVNHIRIFSCDFFLCFHLDRDRK